MLQCRNCGHANRADAKFCEQCGDSLALTCPVCAADVSPDARFCSNCGSALREDLPTPQADGDLSRYLPEALQAKLRSARAGHAMQGERRTVTMLFADIQGSTAAAEQMDPEDWATVVNGAFEHLIAPVYRYEGTLAHLQGDAVLAFFGAPMAHEDDPIRAVRAGLEIVEAMTEYSSRVRAEWGTSVEARVGINTGLVVVGEVGSDLRVEYTALGDAINVAARMEQTADPGTVRVTATTRSLVGAAFEVEDLGPVEVKGKSEPVVAHRVLRFVGEGTDTGGRPLVGRDAELATLDELRDRLTGGSGWIASIVGEAGLGKSRLLQEMRRRSEMSASVARHFEETGTLGWMLATSRSYDSAKPLSSIRSLLARWWGITDSDAGFVKVEGAARQAGFDDPDMASLLGFVAGVDLPESSQAFVDALETSALNRRAAEALRAYIAQLATATPLLLVFEDLHWADDLTLAFVEDLMNLSETAPIGLLFAIRPYRGEPAWRIHEVADREHHHRYRQLDLAPLPGDDSAALVEGLLSQVEISEDSRRKLLDRAGGNPLFIEEMVRSIADSGGATISMPNSLSAILTARLDRLDDRSRFTAQIASVLGVEFRRETLIALLDEPTVVEATADLLRLGIFNEAGLDTLAFRHVLIRDAAYDTILHRTRRDLHRQVAEHLIAVSPGAFDDIAMHLVEANEVERAFPYLVEAGIVAERSMALADAIRLLTLAVDNTPVDADPDLVERAHEALGEAYALVPDLSSASAAYQRLLRYGEEVERPSARVAALNHLGYATASIGLDLEGATTYLDEARQLAEEVGDDVGLAQYHMNACFVASMGGQVAKAAEHDEATVDLGEKAGVSAIRLAGLVRRGVNYTGLVDLAKAEPAVESGLEAANEEGDEESRAVLIALGKGMIRFIKGDVRGAAELSSSEQRTLERYSSFYASLNLLNIGTFYYMLGDLEDALAYKVNSRRRGEQERQDFVAGAAAGGMALIYATAGVGDEVPRLREDALAAIDGPMGEFLASSIWADLGFTSLTLGKYGEAESELASGLNASSTYQFVERPRLLAGRALALALAERPAEAHPPLEEAWSFVRQRGYVAQEPLLRHAEGIVAMAETRYDAAEESLSLAHQAAMDSGQRLLLFQILEARARLARMQGLDDWSQHVESARSLVASMAESIADELLRDRFVSTRSQMLERIGV